MLKSKVQALHRQMLLVERAYQECWKRSSRYVLSVPKSELGFEINEPLSQITIEDLSIHIFTWLKI